ncbi:MAG: citrate/2-methylcitrate synthase [Candidatus Thorarchaeota archaeon]
MTSSISRIDVEKGVLYFRDHVTTTIAFLHDYETVLYLLVNNTLPDIPEKDAMTQRMKKARDEFKNHQSNLFVSDSTSCEYVLQCLAEQIDDWITKEGMSLYDALLRFVSFTPLVINGQWRLSQGLEIIEPTERYGHSGNVLHTLGFDVDFVDLRDFDAGLILHMDDPDNPSLTELTTLLENGDSPGSAIKKAVQAHVDPLHHGAGTNAMRMIRELKETKNLSESLRSRIESGEKIYGLGHRIYKTIDPRAVLLRKFLIRRTMETEHEWLPQVIDEIARVGAEVILEMKGKEVFPNVDLYNAAVYSTMGFPIEFNTYLFAISRVAGWMAHTLDWFKMNAKI